MKTILLISLVVAFSTAQEVTDPPAEEVTPPPTNLTRCNELNLHRLELAKCCKYPHINLHRILIDNCVDECVGSNDICCPIGCLWRITKIVYDTTTVNLNGLKKTLKNSVFHDTEWEELIEKSVDECADEVKFVGLDPSCQFPTHLPKLLGCTIKKLFLQCPKMSELPACEATKEYAQECM